MFVSSPLSQTETCKVSVAVAPNVCQQEEEEEEEEEEEKEEEEEEE